MQAAIAACHARARTAEETDWGRIEALAKVPGPTFWTGHCGGRPLSTQQVWGWGEADAAPCPRHPAVTAAWTRAWPRQALEKAFGPGIESMSLEPRGGRWGLTLIRKGGRRTYGYDEAHRGIAAVLGWDALPSPADQLELTEDGLQLQGVGQGHRVGLCLGK